MNMQDTVTGTGVVLERVVHTLALPCKKIVSAPAKFCESEIA